MNLLEDTKYKIYKATSPSGKLYIGITGARFKSRINNHYSHAKRNNKGFFQRALLKYKRDIIWEIIEDNLTKIQAIDRERFWIKELETMNPEKGYNVTSGGEMAEGYFFANECKKKMSDSAKKRFKNTEKYEKHCLGQKNRYSQKEERDRLAKIRSEYWGNDENRKKQSEKRKKFFENVENRNNVSIAKGGNPFYVFNSNREFIGCWTSQMLCAKDLNLCFSLIRDCLIGLQRQHKGYFFNFKNEFPIIRKNKILKKRTFGIFKDNILLEKFNAQQKCANKYVLQQGRISACLKGARKHHKGYTFKYI